jgi:uncharacterized protein (TIGR00251 family)
MRIYVKIKPKSAEKKIKKINKNQFEIKLTALPIKGEANQQLIELLSKYFKTAKTNIKIIGGKSARTKIIDIEE